jgi:hypothetical protein
MKLSTDIEHLFFNPEVRKSRLGDQSLYSIVDLLRFLTGQDDAAEYWQDLKRWKSPLSALSRVVKMPDGFGIWRDVEMVTLEQALRIIQSVDAPAAERIKLFLADAGRQQLEESADPELALKRARSLYEHRGYSRTWISKRLRGIDARHELTGEWYKRGATESDDFRTLTNELTQSAFGMDVESYKRYKGLRAENLRDHMSDLELALTVLGETTAAILHRDRDSIGVEELSRDVRDAGQITAEARRQIELRRGQPSATPENHTRPLFTRHRRVNLEKAEK